MTLLLFLLLALGSQVAPSGEPPLTGTAAVRGQITDQETGVPIPRAAVTLRLMGRSPSTWVRQNLTDHEGRFEFRQLPAGSYELNASAGEYCATHVHTTYGAMPSGGFRSLMLKSGEVRANIALALPRALAVSGRVTDEFGDPLAGVDVRVTASGIPGSVTRTRRTDDRGQFRLFGVPAGRYIVCANVHYRSGPRAGTRPSPERFVTTCHPSALEEREAQPVILTTADVDGIDIRLRRSRTYTISGVVVDSSGAIAQSATVSFSRYERTGGGSGRTMTNSGRFEHSGILPGEYGIEAYVGAGPEDPSATPRERGYVPVTIVDADATDLVVTMKPPASVLGRIVFEDGRPQAQGPEPMAIECLRAPGGARFGPQTRPAPVEHDLSFTLAGIFDPMRLSVRGLPRGWVVKSVRYRGDDITDSGAEFATDPRHEIEIVVTSRVAIVMGTVTDDAGKPATASIFLIPTAATRSGDDLYRYRAAGTLRDGRFESAGVRAGEYFLLALDSEQSAVVSRQRTPLEALVKHAERITLVENDRLTMDLRVTRIAER
jgi:protocatechuate 3,4-dioxygenase beta subunit